MNLFMSEFLLLFFSFLFYSLLYPLLPSPSFPFLAKNAEFSAFLYAISSFLRAFFAFLHTILHFNVFIHLLLLLFSLFS